MSLAGRRGGGGGRGSPTDGLPGGRDEESDVDSVRTGVWRMRGRAGIMDPGRVQGGGQEAAEVGGESVLPYWREYLLCGPYLPKAQRLTIGGLPRGGATEILTTQIAP